MKEFDARLHKGDNPGAWTCVVMDDVAIDLPDDRDQLSTRGSTRFGQLRGHVFEQIQKAKQGWRPASESAASEHAS